mgnify:FL=1
MIQERDVYMYDGQRTKAAITAFAKTGFQSSDKLGFFKSPFSAIGKTKGIIIAAGSKLLDLHE